MTFRTRCEIARGRIDPAPMVDIVFLLLIFLILSSPFVLQPGIGAVELPEISNAPSATFQTLVLTVNRDNLMFFGTDAVTLEQLPGLLKVEAKRHGNPELIIKADQQVAHGTVVQIMSMAFDAGIPAVNLATRPTLPAPAVAAPE